MKRFVIVDFKNNVPSVGFYTDESVESIVEHVKNPDNWRGGCVPEIMGVRVEFD